MAYKVKIVSLAEDLSVTSVGLYYNDKFLKGIGKYAFHSELPSYKPSGISINKDNLGILVTAKDMLINIYGELCEKSKSHIIVTKYITDKSIVPTKNDTNSSLRPDVVGIELSVFFNKGDGTTVKVYGIIKASRWDLIKSLVKGVYYDTDAGLLKWSEGGRPKEIQRNWYEVEDLLRIDVIKPNA